MPASRFFLRPIAAVIVSTSAATTTLTAYSDSSAEQTTQQAVTQAAVVENYTNLAFATFQDALITAKALDMATDALIQAPSEETLKAAKQAWLAARIPYMQTEVLRFGNAIVDNWEGQLNAWPLDEGLIDYVDTSGYHYALGNAGASANIIASQTITIGGESIDVGTLTPELLASLNEIGGSEANVATGYHAIEFLLWGQDLHGFEPGAGERPVTDYSQNDNCTHGNCDRRATYLDAATDLLVNDLQWMVAQWAPNDTDNYRAELLAMPPSAVIEKMLFGMGSLSLGELAGERMKVALEANSFEDEHDCFSDNTHNSHFYNAKGIQNVYLGTYTRVDGSVIEGPSLANLVAEANPELDTTLTAQLETTMDAVGVMKQKAEAETRPITFDMLIAPGNAEGAKVVNDSIVALVRQTGSIEKVARDLGIESMQPDDAGHAF